MAFLTQFELELHNHGPDRTVGTTPSEPEPLCADSSVRACIVSDAASGRLPDGTEINQWAAPPVGLVHLNSIVLDGDGSELGGSSCERPQGSALLFPLSKPKFMQ